MYYFAMKTAVRPYLKSNNFCSSKSFTSLKEKEICVDIKFYQKLFIVFISISTLLIFPDSPRELEDICESNNSSKVCNVW